MDVGLIEDTNLVRRSVANARILLEDARKQFSRLYMDYRACEVGLDQAVLEETAGETEHAIEIVEELLARARTLRFPYIIATGQQLLAGWYRTTGMIGKALEAATDAVEGWERLGNRDSLALAYGELGESHAEKEDWPTAFDWHRQSRELFKHLGYRHGIALAENNMAYCQMMLKEHKNARTIFKGSLKEFERLGIDEDIIKTQLHIINNEFLARKRKRAKQLLWRLLESKPLKQYPELYAYAYRIVTREEWLREDPEFAELFAPPPKLAIKRAILEEIIHLARQKHPQEFGALLHGKQIIADLEHVPETAHGRSSVIFNLYNRMSQRKIYADGVAHSHPSGVARPSKADLSLFGTFPGINIIIGFPYTKDSWAAYDRLGNRVKVDIID